MANIPLKFDWIKRLLSRKTSMSNAALYLQKKQLECGYQIRQVKN